VSKWIGECACGGGREQGTRKGGRDRESEVKREEREGGREGVEIEHDGEEGTIQEEGRKRGREKGRGED